MKLFKKLAASMMCLLLAVVVFAGCSSQFKQAKFSVPNDDKFEQVTTDEGYVEALQLITKQASTFTDEEGNVVFEGNGTLEALIRSAKLSVTISKAEAPENEDEVVDPEAVTEDGGSIMGDIMESIAGFLANTDASIEFTGVVKLSDNSFQLALELKADLTVDLPTEETNEETGEPVLKAYTFKAGAKGYYKDGYIYLDASASGNGNSAKAAIKVSAEELDILPSEEEICQGANESLFAMVNRRLAELSEALKTEEGRAEVLDTVADKDDDGNYYAELYKYVNGSKTYYKLVLTEEAAEFLFDGLEIPCVIYMEFNNDKLVKVSAYANIMGLYNVQVVLEKYTSGIKFPSFKNYKDASDEGVMAKVEGDFYTVFAPLVDIFMAR